MDTSVLLFEARAGRLTTPDGAWQFAVKTPPARERDLPRGDISLIVNLEGHHAIVDATDARREHVFKDAWVTGLQERAFLTASGGRAWLCGARLTVEGAYACSAWRRASLQIRSWTWMRCTVPARGCW